MPELTIRRARRADVPAIVRLLADDDLGRGRDQPTDPLQAAYLDAFERIEADARNLLVVGEDSGGDVVATLQLTFIPGLSNHGAEIALIEAVRVASPLVTQAASQLQHGSPGRAGR